MLKSPGNAPGASAARRRENTTSTITTVTSHFTMIELYTWSTPNGRKVSIMLEECGLPYNVHKINIGTNAEQFTPEYLKINPNGKIPSIVDPDGPGGKPIAMMESGAILIYLADKTGKFLPQNAASTRCCSGSCSRWAASARCSARRTTSCARRRTRSPTAASATATRRSACTA